MERVTLPDEVYARLLALRTGLRQFERWSEQQAQKAGLTPAQHQLLLAVRGHGDPRGPTIGEIADYLLLRHHSAVGLVDRADAAGLVRRTRDEDDHRVVRLLMTTDGAARLEALSTLHLEELVRLAPQVPEVWAGLGTARGSHGLSGRIGGRPERQPPTISVARVYDDIGEGVGNRILVDRLWPRGVSRSDRAFDLWLREVAPSAALRKWYSHDPVRFDEFGRRYRAELADETEGVLDQLPRARRRRPGDPAHGHQGHRSLIGSGVAGRAGRGVSNAAGSEEGHYPHPAPPIADPASEARSGCNVVMEV